MLAYRRLEHSVAAKDLSHIEEYTKEDLMNQEDIELIYKCIYRYDIHITQSGWEFLIEYYGYEILHEIDKSCECCFGAMCVREGIDNSLENYIKWINSRIQSYPEVPDYIYKAHRPKNIAKTVLYVKTVEEVAELFEMSIECVQELDRELKKERAEYEKEQKKRMVPDYIKAGKPVEEIAKELGVSIDYVREMDIRIKENQLKAEKIRKTVYALNKGKTAEEIAKEIEMPLDFVQEFERKIKR